MTNEKIKTGTTCIGLLFKGGVMLAADKRVTSYKINSDSFTKIFDLSKNVVATVSGGASDAQLFMRHVKSQLKLIELKTERQVLVSEAAMILNSIQYGSVRSQGSIVGSILGGYDKKDGISLYDLGPDGTIVNHEGFVTSGSGSVYVDGILGTEYKSDMSESEALELIDKGFRASFKNDNASGGGYIVKMITNEGIKEAERKVVKTELVKE